MEMRKDGMSYLDMMWLKNYPSDLPKEVEIPEIALTQLINEFLRGISIKLL